jgi:hypothetical protein
MAFFHLRTFEELSQLFPSKRESHTEETQSDTEVEVEAKVEITDFA